MDVTECLTGIQDCDNASFYQDILGGYFDLIVGVVSPKINAE